MTAKERKGMKKTVVITIFLISMFFLESLGIIVPVASADVLGTSVVVTEAVVDVKSIETKEVGRGGNITSYVTLTNTSENEEIIEWGLENYPIEIKEIGYNEFEPGLTKTKNKQYNPELRKPYNGYNL